MRRELLKDHNAQPSLVNYAKGYIVVPRNTSCLQPDFGFGNNKCSDSIQRADVIWFAPNIQLHWKGDYVSAMVTTKSFFRIQIDASCSIMDRSIVTEEIEGSWCA